MRAAGSRISLRSMRATVHSNPVGTFWFSLASVMPAASEDALQRWWRPLYALELSLLECPAFAATLLHALWSGHDKGINGFAALSGLLMTYFAARFGVLGVYVTGRTREKQAAITGEAAPSLAAEVVKAVRGRR